MNLVFSVELLIVSLFLFMFMVILILLINKCIQLSRLKRQQINTVDKDIVVELNTCIPEKEEVVGLLTNLLNVGFTNLSLTEQSTLMVHLLKNYYNLDYVTFYIKGSDGWFSTLATNMPSHRVTKTERYYNNESKLMCTDSKVTVLEPYEKESFLRSVNVEYSNFTLIKQNGNIIGALLLEHSNKLEVESNENQFKLYDKVFNTTSLVLCHLVELGDLIKKISTDQLTDVYNRRFIDVTLDEELIKHKNLGQSFHIAMMDIDYFKKFNDTYGHQFGDKVLQVVSNYIKTNLGVHSWVARYGGEEFLICIPNSCIERVYTKIDSLREGISNLDLCYDGQQAKVTVSFGISGSPKDGLTKESLICKADKALYYSKEKGRNQVTKWCDVSK